MKDFKLIVPFEKCEHREVTYGISQSGVHPPMEGHNCALVGFHTWHPTHNVDIAEGLCRGTLFDEQQNTIGFEKWTKMLQQEFREEAKCL